MQAAGYTKEDTKTAAQIVANYLHYADDLKGNGVEVKQLDNVLSVSTSTPKERIGKV